jgi:hypothetical protein
MFRNNFILAVIVLLAFNCLGQGNFQSQKAMIDTTIKKNNVKPIMLAKLTDKPDLIEFNGIDYPPYLESTYYIFKDASGKIVKISESPYNESGEWTVFLSHYFNQQGNTFAFERFYTFFSIICSEGVATHTTSEFYSDNLQLQNKEIKFIDEYAKDLAKDSCQLPVNVEYTVIKNLNEYMTKKNIRLNK